MSGDLETPIRGRWWRQPLYWLLIALPVAAWLQWIGAGQVGVFAASAIAVVPLAGIMGRATESLSGAFGPNIGGLLNATFGNAAELIIGVMMLRRGPQMYPLVKASLTGSIIGNILLVLGAAILAGGLRFHQQKFNRHSAGMGATLLALAAIGLVMPTLYYYVFRSRQHLTSEELENVGNLSEEIACILAAIYGLSLLFTLRTHRKLVGGIDPPAENDRSPNRTSRIGSLVALLAATIGVAWMSHLLVGSIEEAAHSLGMNSVFTGVIVVAVVGNAAEHSTAVAMALKDRLDVAVNIAIGSGIQIALLAAPLLVFASLWMGQDPILDLHFSPLEMIAVLLSVGVMNLVSHDGESNWMEGVMLLGVYFILALAFYHLPEP